MLRDIPRLLVNQGYARTAWPVPGSAPVTALWGKGILMTTKVFWGSGNETTKVGMGLGPRLPRLVWIWD